MGRNIVRMSYVHGPKEAPAAACVHNFEGHFHNIPPRINIGYAYTHTGQSHGIRHAASGG